MIRVNSSKTELPCLHYEDGDSIMKLGRKTPLMGNSGERVVNDPGVNI